MEEPIINRKISQMPKLKAENVRITRKFKERAKPYNFKKRISIYRKLSDLRYISLDIDIILPPLALTLLKHFRRRGALRSTAYLYRTIGSEIIHVLHVL